MSYSCSDFADDVLNALAITVPDEHRENPDHQANLACSEIWRLQQCEKLLRDNRDRIIAALIAMQDSDNELGHPEEAKASADLILLLQNLPDQEPAESHEDEEDEEGDDASGS